MDDIAPIPAVEPVVANDSSRKLKAPQDVADPKAVGPMDKAQHAAALHVAPAAHAVLTRNDPAAAAAVNEERGRAAVDRIEGPAALHPLNAATPHPGLHLRPQVLSRMHLHADFWDVVDTLRHATPEQTHALLSKHPAVAQQIAHAFILSGGATALAGLQHAENAAPPPYAKPTPEEPKP